MTEVTLDIAATDDEDTIREKVRAIMEPLDAKARRRVIADLDLQLQAIECAAMKHAGIGLPGCPVCAPRTRAKLAKMGIEGYEDVGVKGPSEVPS